MAGEPPPIPADELLAHAEWVRRLARALVRDETEARDLAQDALEAALAKPPQREGPLGPWLTGVVKNLARLRFRAGARRRRREEASEVETHAPTPETLVERAQAQQLVARLVLELDEPFRTTLLLRYYEGLTAAEIARRLDVPPGTVRWRLKRGLDALRGELDGAMDDDRSRWTLLLTPLADAAPAFHATTTLAKGVVLMKVTKLLIAAVVALLLALLATRGLGLWGDSRGSAASTTSKSKGGGGRAAHGARALARQSMAAPTTERD